MPPKKGKGKKEKKEKKEKEVIPPDEFDEMELDQLQDEVKKFSVKLNEIRRNRNYYLLERDQVQQFYDIVHTEVDKTSSHIRNIESQMEKMQETHRNDIRIYLQKVIHLEYEHANNVDAVSNMGSQDRAQAEFMHLKKKSDVKKEKESLKGDLRNEELAYEEEINSLETNQQKQIVKQEQEFEENQKMLHDKYERRLKELIIDLELRRKMEIHEIEERKNRHINDLMDNHAKAFNEMRNYYNSITQDNLALIKSLHDEIEDLKIKHVQNEKAMEDIERKNETLSEPLRAAEAEVQRLQALLVNYDKDMVSLKHAKARLAAKEDALKVLRVKHRDLMLTHNNLTSERDTLYMSFEGTLRAVQQRSEAKNLVLENMLEEYKNIFEQKKAQFTSVLRASNLDPVVLQNVTRKLDDVLTSKNEQIQELKYECAKVMKAHNDLVRVYKAKAFEAGVPKEELDLEPLLGSTSSAPADLVAL